MAALWWERRAEIIGSEARLEEISCEILVLPELTRVRTGDIPTIAGELILEALALGAFGASKYAELRVTIRAYELEGGRHWYAAAWERACVELCPELLVEVLLFTPKLCAVVAKAITKNTGSTAKRRSKELK